MIKTIVYAPTLNEAVQAAAQLGLNTSPDNQVLVLSPRLIVNGAGRGFVFDKLERVILVDAMEYDDLEGWLAPLTAASAHALRVFRWTEVTP